MNSRRKYCNLGILFFIIPIVIMAGSDKQNGTSGALELLIPPDAAGAGIGGSCVAYINGIDAIHWNPAGIVRTEAKAEVLFSQLDYFSDIKLNYLAIQFKLKHEDFLALSIKRLSFGDIPVTTEFAPDGTGDMFSPGFTVVSMTYGKSVLDKVQTGVSVKYISEIIANVRATGFALDAGIQYELNPRFRMGVTLRNWGPKMRFNGPGLNRKVNLPGSIDEPIAVPEQLRIVAAEFEIPTVADIGFSYHALSYMGHCLLLNGTFQNQHYGWDRYGLGAVWQMNLRRGSIHLKAGIQAALQPSTHVLHFQDEQNLLGPCTGFEIRYPYILNMAISFNYAYTWTEYFENIHWFSLSFRFFPDKNSTK